MELRISDIVEATEVLGLSVKYDAKERIQVVATADNSLSSVHLRPGDIIRYFWYSIKLNTAAAFRLNLSKRIS